MISVIQTAAKVAFFAITLIAFVQVLPASALQPVAYVSSTGNDANPCTAAQPCASFSAAIGSLENGGQINCINAPDPQTNVNLITAVVFTIDCPGSVWEGGGESPTLELGPSVAILRHLTISNAFENATQPAIQVTGSGTLIIDDCLIQSASGAALNITPNGAFNLVVTNTRIAKNASGIVIQPSSGGSVTATLDHVIIVQNNGGGLKIDTANGPVTTDITDSVISDNSGNGINAVGNAGGQAIISIKNSVIAKNGVAGVQANGANAGVLIATTLLDQNVSGATAVVGGGNLFTYGNNDIVGSIGSGFTGTATMH